jgi:hypothetical protein
MASKNLLTAAALNATLSSRSPRQAVEGVADAGAVPVLFDRDDLYRAVLPGSGLRVRTAPLPADGLATDRA